MGFLIYIMLIKYLFFWKFYLFWDLNKGYKILIVRIFDDCLLIMDIILVLGFFFGILNRYDMFRE